MVLIAAQALTVSADYDDDIAAVQSQQAETNAELSNIEGSITDMETQKAAVLEQIDGYNAELVMTIAAIKSLDAQVTEAEEALKETGVKLAEAEENQETQYEAMKKRIQYLYEQGGSNGWVDIMLGQTELSAGMNNVDNTQSLYKYDREELTAYTNTITEVTDLQTQQTEQKSALETMLLEQEEAKANLETLKAQAQAESDDYETQIANAEAVAAEYYALIEQQNAQIAELQQKKAEEEEAARKAAEEAARRAAEEEAARQAAAATAAAQATAQTTSGTSTQSSDGGYTGEQAAQAAATQAALADGSVSAVDTTGGAGSAAVDAPVSSSGVTGQDVVNYACQFVGNPYVWGGTSLTNGADCSGFVQQVYKHFGYNLSRTTYTQANEGIPVSYSEMVPGDVINYGFHTAIYMGNNQIVHAASSNLGIITQSNPAFQAIVTIRRFIY